jgi:hypothetical protein
MGRAAYAPMISPNVHVVSVLDEIAWSHKGEANALT